MNKVIRFIQSYLVIGLPFVVVCAAWETVHPSISTGLFDSFLEKTLWQVLSINLMIWFITVITFLIILVIVPAIREKTLRRLANLKERDEREEYITGKASRATYISTLSIMIFFLFFSMFSVSVTKLPEDQAVAGHRTTVSIGMGFSLLTKSNEEKVSQGKVLFDSKNISLSSTSILLVIIMWQLLSFNLVARKQQKNS